MWRLIPKTPTRFLPRNPFINGTSSHRFCSSEEEKIPFRVRQINNMLTNGDWLPRLESSDVPNKLTLETVRSVIGLNCGSNPQKAVNFFLWTQNIVGNNKVGNHLKDIDLYSFIIVSLCNYGYLVIARNVIDRMIDTWKSPMNVLNSVVKGFRESDSWSDKPVVFDMLVDRYRNAGLSVEAGEVFLGLKTVDEFKPGVALCKALLGALLKGNNFEMFWKIIDRMSELKINLDARSYTSVIIAHFRCGNPESAKRVLFEMEDKGLHADLFIYNSVIYGLCRAGRPEEALEIRGLIGRKGLVPDAKTYTNLITGFNKENLFGHAKSLLFEMVDAGLKPDPPACYAVIDGLVKMGQLNEAFEMKDEMIRRGLPVTLASYNVLLAGVSKADDKTEGKVKEVFDEMKKMGIAPDLTTHLLLIEEYCKEKDMDRAVQTFNLTKMKFKRSIVAYGIMIQGQCNIGHPAKALSLIEEAIRNGLKPDPAIYNPLISVYLRNDQLDEAKKVIHRMTEQGVSPNVRSYNALILGLCKAEKFESASDCFASMLSHGLQPDKITYEACIKMYCKTGEITMANENFHRMLDLHLVPDESIYGILIDGHCKERNLELAFSAFAHMLEFESRQGVQTYSVLINVLTRNGYMQEAMRFYSELCEKGLNPDICIYNSLIVGFCKHDDLDKAMKLLEEMCEKGVTPDILTFNALIDGQCIAGNFEKAKKLFREISKNGLVPRYSTYVMIIDCYIRSGDVFEAFKLLDGPSDHSLLHDILLDEFCERGMFEEAKGLLRDMSIKGLASTASFNKLVERLCLEKKIRDANGVLEDMFENEIWPNYETYSIMINYHCEARNMDEAKRLFLEMRRMKISPTVETFALLLRGYNSAGDTFEALALFEEMVSMGIEPDESTYDVAIAANCKEGNVTEALRLRDEMSEKGNISLSSSTENDLVRALCRREEFARAFDLLIEIGEADSRLDLGLCSIIASGFQRSGNSDKSAEVLKSLVEFGWVSSSTTLTDLIEGNLVAEDSEDSE